MDISKIIAANLTAWMQATPSLDTIQKVEAKSGAGFGTVRRARKGEGNITVEKLAMIAAAFGKTPADLVTPQPGSADLPNPLRDYLLPSSNVQPAPFAAESRTTYATDWPFLHVSQRAYESLSPEAQLWVQGRIDAAIEQARQEFGTAVGKRSA